MKRGEFIISVQLDPPKEEHFGELASAVSELKQKGITVFDINGSRRDCMDPFDVAARLADNNVELIPHITARDAGLTPILRQIKKEYTEHDVNNVLVITGDRYKPLEDGTPDPRNVFQTKSVGIISSIHRCFNQEDRKITIAAAVNHNETNLTKEANRLKAKDKQGADFFMSQTVFDIDQAQKAHDFYAEHVDKPLLMGVWPLTKISTIDAIRDGKIKGVTLSDEVYRQADALREEPEALKEWGFEKAAETVNYIKENNLAQGIYVVAPLRQPDQLLPFIDKI